MLAITGASRPAIASRASAPAVQTTSDQSLIKGIADGDRRAMQLLYTRHSVRVYRFVLRLTGDPILAEDLVSEVFIDVWRQAERFKSEWLLAIARYKALSALRRRLEEQLDESAAVAIADPAADPETPAHDQIRSAVVQNCLLKLSAVHREVLDLVYYHEKSVDEVAHIVGVPVSTVKTRMFYARKQMEKLLGAAGIDAL